MYIPTSFWPWIPTNYVPTYVLISTHIIYILPHIYEILNSFVFPFSQLTPRVKIVSLMTHDSICTHALMSLFIIWLTQISTKTITHVSQYRLFLANGLSYTTKTSHNHIKKTTFAQLFQFLLNIFSPIFLHVSWQVDIPRCQEVRELDEFNQYVSQTGLPPNLIHSLPTPQLDMMSSRHDSLTCLKSSKSFPRQNLWSVFKLPLVDLSSSP